MSDGLTTEELKAVFDSAKSLKLDPAKLKDVNPFDRDLKTPVSEALRMHLQEHHPVIAAQLSSKSGYRRSLAAACFEAGIGEKTNAVHEELMENNPLYVQQFKANQQSEEERMREMDQAADKLAKARGVVKDDDDVQVMNPAMAGRFANYAEQVNLQARRERRWAQEGK